MKDLRIGVPRAFVTDGVDDQVRRAFDEALDTLRGSGATLVDIDLPHAKYAVPVYYLVCTAEASSNLARYDGVSYGYRSGKGKDSLKEMYSRTRDEGFGPEVKRRIMLGTYVLSAGYYDAFYLKALQVRTLLRRDYDQAFERVDVVAMPTSPTPAFRLGEKTDDPLQMYLADVFTVSANLAGLPGDQRAVRLLDRRACRSAFSSWDGCSTRRRCCASPMRTNASPNGTRAHPLFEPVFQRAGQLLVVLAHVHRGDRHVAVLNGPDIGVPAARCRLRGTRSSKWCVPTDASSPQNFPLRRASTPVWSPCTLVTAGRHRRDVDVEKRVRWKPTVLDSPHDPEHFLSGRGVVAGAPASASAAAIAGTPCMTASRAPPTVPDRYVAYARL